MYRTGRRFYRMPGTDLISLTWINKTVKLNFKKFEDIYFPFSDGWWTGFTQHRMQLKTHIYPKSPPSQIRNSLVPFIENCLFKMLIYIVHRYVIYTLPILFQILFDNCAARFKFVIIFMRKTIVNSICLGMFIFYS